MYTDWAIGFIGSLFIAGAAYWKKSLSGSGMAAAVVLGTVMYAAGSEAWFGTLIAFFRYIDTVVQVEEEKKIRCGERLCQNRETGRRPGCGKRSLGGLLCVLFALKPSPVWWVMFIGVMATVNADTWATEVGGLSRTLPRSIATGRTVPAGTSGGITALGLTATAAGAVFIGIAAWLFMHLDRRSTVGAQWEAASLAGFFWPLTAAAGIGGIVGSLADSLLGATVQIMYKCPSCGKESEKKASLLCAGRACERMEFYDERRGKCAQLTDWRGRRAGSQSLKSTILI